MNFKSLSLFSFEPGNLFCLQDIPVPSADDMKLFASKGQKGQKYLKNFYEEHGESK